MTEGFMSCPKLTYDKQQMRMKQAAHRTYSDDVWLNAGIQQQSLQLHT